METVERDELRLESGFGCDLVHWIMLAYNPDSCFELQGQRMTAPEDREFYSQLLTQYGAVREELMPLFTQRDGGDSFLEQHWGAQLAQVGPEVTAEQLSAIIGGEALPERVLGYLFPELTADQCRTLAADPAALVPHIRGSQLSAELKSALYGLLLDPAGVGAQLLAELTDRAAKLAELYRSEGKLLDSITRKLDPALVQDYLTRSRETKKLAGQPLRVAPVLTATRTVKVIPGEQPLVLLGREFAQALRDGQGSRDARALHQFGNALAELSRAQILNMLLESEEITIREIERRMNFSGTNTYYHLNLMVRTGLLKTRNRGKIILYSLNRPYFDTMIKLLGKYGRKSR